MKISGFYGRGNHTQDIFIWYFYLNGQKIKTRLMQTAGTPVRNHHLVQNGCSSGNLHQSASSSSFSSSDDSQRIVTAGYRMLCRPFCKEPSGSCPPAG